MQATGRINLKPRKSKHSGTGLGEAKHRSVRDLAVKQMADQLTNCNFEVVKYVKA
jgi:hypothetical protein